MFMNVSTYVFYLFYKFLFLFKIKNFYVYINEGSLLIFKKTEKGFSLHASTVFLNIFLKYILINFLIIFFGFFFIGSTSLTSGDNDELINSYLETQVDEGSIDDNLYDTLNGRESDRLVMSFDELVDDLETSIANIRENFINNILPETYNIPNRLLNFSRLEFQNSQLISLQYFTLKNNSILASTELSNIYKNLSNLNEQNELQLILNSIANNNNDFYSRNMDHINSTELSTAIVNELNLNNESINWYGILRQLSIIEHQSMSSEDNINMEIETTDSDLELSPINNSYLQSPINNSSISIRRSFGSPNRTLSRIRSSFSSPPSSPRNSSFNQIVPRSGRRF